MRGRTLPLVAALTRAGHSVMVFTLSGQRQPPFVAEDNQSGVSVKTVGPNLRATDASWPGFWTTVSRFRQGHRALRDALSDAKADLIVLAKPQPQNTSAALEHAKTLRVPLIADIDDLEAYASRLPWPVRRYVASLEARALRRALVVTACSPFLVEHARRINPAARVELLPTGIEVPKDVPPIRFRERLSLPAEARVILYVGSLSRASGHRVDHLLDAFAVLREPETYLVLAGGGTDADALRARVRSLPGAVSQRVHFWGSFSPPEDVALAREVNLLVDPVDASVVNAAKSSHRVMLALATGTPVIAGNVGIRPTLLPPSLHAVCLYTPEKPGDLTRALRRGLDPGFRALFERETKHLAHQWTWQELGKRFVRIVEETTRP